MAGLLFSLGLAPFNYSGLTIISLSIWFYLLQTNNLKNSLLLSWLYGIGKYGLGISWIYVSISNFSELHWFFSFLITCTFIAFLSLYEVLLSLIYKRLSKKLGNLMNCLSFSALGVLIEALRSWLFTGLPWLLAGHSQLTTPLHKLAPILGSISLSFMCYLIASFINQAFFIHQTKKTYNYLYAFMCILPFIMVDKLTPSNWTTPIQQSLSVSLLQGNVSHDLKWNEEQLYKSLELYQQLTRSRLIDDLIVWPETALPMPSLYAMDILSALKNSAYEHHSSVILGAPGMNADGSLSNSMFLLGKKTGRYDKQHLVPFGEYMPIKMFHPLYKWFNIPFAELNTGDHATDLFNVKDLTIAPFICFEIAFNHSAHLQKMKQSNLLLTITDDSWFGHSFAKAQHLQIAQMRSLEAGRPQLFASNDGLTAFINEKGNITKTMPAYKRGYLNNKIKGVQGNTPFLNTGNKPILSMAFGILLLAILT